MANPRVPSPDDGDGYVLDLPCGERVDAVLDIDMGQRDYDCACGERHAVVMDVHPPSRFVPEDVVAVLREAVETVDEFGEFGTPHLMGAVMEEYPEKVAVVDVSEEPSAGYALVWMTDFDSRRLHEVVVELVVELMEHAVGHAEDEDSRSEFEAQMLDFDVGEFVEAYRARRDFSDEFDRPA